MERCVCQGQEKKNEESASWLQNEHIQTQTIKARDDVRSRSDAAFTSGAM